MMIRTRSGYSFRVAAGTLDEVASRLADIGATAAPLTDLASTFGWTKWRDACKKHGLRPVFGVELAVSPEPNASKPLTDMWTFLARDNVAPINRLVQTATAQFRYQPLLSYVQALADRSIVAVAGHRADLDRVDEVFRRYGDNPHFYVALSPACAPGYIRRVRERGYRFVAAGNNLHPREGDLGFQQVACSMNAAMRTYPTHILSPSEWLAAMQGKGCTDAELEAALALSQEVLDRCTADLPTAQMVRPERPATLRAMCEAGAARIGCDLSRPEYAARLAEELRVIQAKGFEDYFYVMSGLMNYARGVMTCGPGRGSSAGSLACYLLGITFVDPIPHGLLFSRFLDETRSDFPDVDSDFNDGKRDLLFDYARRTYGANRVARLGTVAMFGGRAAAEEAGKALGLAPWAFRPVVDAMVKHAAGAEEGKHALRDALRDSDAGKVLLREYPEAEIVTRVENHPRHAGQHAAGIVITQTPVSDVVAVDSRTGATHCDKVDAEKLGLLKIDALGLIQLGVIEDCLRDVGLPHDHMDTVSLDDPAVMEVFNQRRFSGIFQFTGSALKGLSRQVTFRSFADIAALTALARPGPMGSGGAARWIARNAGKEPVRYVHPAFEPFLRETLGVMTYQEQVMAIAREIGGMAWGEVNALRKAIGKSLGASAMAKYEAPFKTGAAAKGIPADVVDRVWDDILENGKYSFNKSHSVAYGMVSYWCAWLKTYYPMEFAAATLQHQKDADDQIGTLRELALEGVDYVPVHGAMSTDRWRVGTVGGERKLIGPVQNVNGIGPKMVAVIVGARARGEPLPERAMKLLANPVTKLDSLWPIRDAFFRLMPDPGSCNIHTPRSQIGNLLNGTDEEVVVVFARLEKMARVDENEPKRVERRGRKVEEALANSVNLSLADDTGTIFAKVHGRDYERIGKAFLARGGVGKALYAVKGTVRGDSDFRMIWVQQVRYIGSL